MLLAIMLDEIEPININRFNDFVAFKLDVEHLYKNHGEFVYDILKDYETLTVVSILIHDPYLNSDTLFKETLKGIEDISPYFKTCSLYTRLTLPNMSKEYLHHLLGCLGWLKCFGHPHIIPELGINQMLKNIEHDKYHSVPESINIAYQFKKMFMTGFYLKHRNWSTVFNPNHIPGHLLT